MFRKNKESEPTPTGTTSGALSNAVSDNNPFRDYLTRLTNRLDSMQTPMCGCADSEYATAYSITTKAHAEGLATNPDHIRMLEEIHAAVCTHLSFAESIAELTDVLDSMECPTNECKSCKYYRPGGVDFCNTSLRIAEYLVLNGIVNVFHVPGLDKTE